MPDTDKTDSETEMPRGVFVRFVFPTLAVFTLMFAAVGNVWDFSQQMSEPRPEGNNLVSVQFDIDTPVTQWDEPAPKPVVEVAEAVAPTIIAVPAQAVSAPARAPRRVQADTPAMAAISALAPSAASKPETLAGALAYSTPVEPTRNGPGEFLVVTGNGPLNVRKAPSSSEEKLFMLSSNQRVEIVGVENDWTEILTDTGDRGWASSEFLMTPEEAARLAEAASAKAEVAATNTRTARSGVNVRKGPGRNHGTVFTLASGEKVSVTDQSDDGWMKVKTNGGKAGWVYKSYLR